MTLGEVFPPFDTLTSFWYL